LLADIQEGKERLIWVDKFSLANPFSIKLELIQISTAKIN
jgi:hypothetical protein